MNELFITIGGWTILALGLVAIVCTFYWRKWSRHYRSKTIYYLYRSALVKTLAAIPLTGLAAYRIVGGPEAPPVPFGGPILIICIVTMIGNLAVTTFAFRDLNAFYVGDQVNDFDKALDTKETIHEYEDRTFGEARRALEEVHAEEVVNED